MDTTETTTVTVNPNRKAAIALGKTILARFAVGVVVAVAVSLTANAIVNGVEGALEARKTPTE